MRTMRIGWVVLSLFATLLSVGTSKALAQQGATIEDVILLAQSDLADETILVFLDYREIAFSLGATEVLRLRQGGVSEEVIRYLIKRSGAPAELAPKVVSESYPPRYYATYLGSGSNFYVGGGYYPYWWWNDYYYLHFFPLHSFSGGHHSYLGHFGYGSHSTFGHQRARSFSGHLVSVGGQSHAGSISIPRHPFGHRDGRSSLGSSSVGHSSLGSSRGGHLGLGSSRGGHLGLGSSRGGHSSGGHFGGGHSSGGHSGGGHGGHG